MEIAILASMIREDQKEMGGPDGREVTSYSDQSSL